MFGTAISLEDMLAAREYRAVRQEALLQQYHHPLVSFALNIPGSVKTNPSIRAAYQLGKERLLTQLEEAGVEIIAQEERLAPSGDELMLVVNGSAERLKQLTCSIEEADELGRLFDMDVLDKQGHKLARPHHRPCLLCPKDAKDCARSRAHSLEELESKVDDIIQNALEK
ncbi:citrate lyase holo-[acyl-carrier protein] synthase [Atopobacter sp. AH10]|uniref:citrate lyase holo-[acyl-carrier protein] synthase n=1 Tax=Atopobacter sp. AH10 TaxID=2315861 RepID=UPI000EF1AACD|nr:citrate lyase holo-[acyl-carrier protein] synthase [Atopobacter sp. AH10]RLK63431.1 citrate lyase holo-[acyl-carrier protein] synthase [Atopobacter sp. AH10]